MSALAPPSRRREVRDGLFFLSPSDRLPVAAVGHPCVHPGDHPTPLRTRDQLGGEVPEGRDVAVQVLVGVLHRAGRRPASGPGEGSRRQRPSTPCTEPLIRKV